MHVRMITVLALLLAAAVVWAADKPAEKPGEQAAEQPAQKTDKPASLVGEPREQTLESRSILFGSTQTTFDKILDTINEILPKLRAAVRDQKVPVAGPVIFIYHNANPQDGKPFTLDIGVIVAPEAQPAGDFKVKKLDAFKCDTILLSGPISGISEAYGKLMPFVFDKKHEPNGEVREAYLYWESPESLNNVVQIQVGTK